jgi:hypothetical protein
VNGLFTEKRAISNGLEKWLKLPEGVVYTHITIIYLSVVSICTADISKLFSLQSLRKSR